MPAFFFLGGDGIACGLDSSPHDVLWCDAIDVVLRLWLMFMR